jgi:hypothetical protein
MIVSNEGSRIRWLLVCTPECQGLVQIHAIQLYAIHIGKCVVRIGKPRGHPHKYACRP